MKLLSLLHATRKPPHWNTIEMFDDNAAAAVALTFDRYKNTSEQWLPDCCKHRPLFSSRVSLYAKPQVGTASPDTKSCYKYSRAERKADKHKATGNDMTLMRVHVGGHNKQTHPRNLREKDKKKTVESHVMTPLYLHFSHLARTRVLLSVLR